MRYRDVVGGGQFGKKNLLHWALEAPIAHVHKTTYGPLINTALHVMLLMRANPFRGQVGGGWSLEISTFWAPVALA
jgi:hypothetical protein